MRSPLNLILGTEANVRLLRVLTVLGTPMSQADAAKSAGLNPSGAGRSLAALEEIGIVEYVGAEGRKLVSLRGAHPLANAIRDLFAAERSWFESLVARMQEVAKQLPGPPKAVWIEGPVVTGDDTIADAIGLGVLAMAKELPEVMAALEGPIDRWSDDLDVTVEPRGLTMADLEALSGPEMDRLQMVVPLLGPPPLVLAGRWKVVTVKRRTHADLDAEALRRSGDVVERLKADPGLVARALVALRARISVASGGEKKELREWERILTSMSLPRLRRFLVDPGERATRLRQTLPFDWVMTPNQQLDVAVKSRAKRRAK